EPPDGRPYLVLLRVGFTWTADVTARAVRSYRTISPLPAAEAAWRFVFCGTFPGVAPAGRYPAPCFRGARTFLPAINAERPSGHLARRQHGPGAGAGQADLRGKPIRRWRVPARGRQ